jgi:hypothetical protein
MNETRQWLSAQCEGTIPFLYPMFDAAVIGVAVRNGENLAVYDEARMLRVLVERMDMSEAEARAWMAASNALLSLAEDSPIIIKRFRKTSKLTRSTNAEITRLRAALVAISMNHSEPYARDFARDALDAVYGTSSLGKKEVQS